MNIAELDKNFAFKNIDRTDIEWYDIQSLPDLVFGVTYDEKLNRYMRMPQTVADSVNEGVSGLCRHTAGGRIRFKTNSSFIALKGMIDNTGMMYHMPSTGSHGFGLYENGKYLGPLSSRFSMEAKGSDVGYSAIRNCRSNQLKDIDIYFPLYNGVKSVFIGLQTGSVLEKPNAYPIEKPVVFYGSSITQGGCASHPGNDYEGHLCRWLGFDFINLGFSGNAKGEQEMAEYLATLDASVYVLDYDHNAPTVEHLQQTHYPFYKRLRALREDTPILCISKPDFDGALETNANRREIIMETVRRAKADGDKKIWFLDGEKLFGECDRDACTVDGCHPNDLGFYRMAENIRPVLEEILKGEKGERL